MAQKLAPDKKISVSPTFCISACLGSWSPQKKMYPRVQKFNDFHNHKNGYSLLLHEEDFAQSSVPRLLHTLSSYQPRWSRPLTPSEEEISEDICCRCGLTVYRAELRSFLFCPTFIHIGPQLEAFQEEDQLNGNYAIINCYQL